ncbi:hypothetical protein SALB1_2306 [Salinisphaera sp. LB1]|nr:hypothetical protein SALB1_2306 [Salinisphaera sp. LB1]
MSSRMASGLYMALASYEWRKMLEPVDVSYKARIAAPDIP